MKQIAKRNEILLKIEIIQYESLIKNYIFLVF